MHQTISAFEEYLKKSNCAPCYFYKNIGWKFNNSIQKNHIFNCLMKHQPDILGLSGTNIVWNNAQGFQYNNVLFYHWPHHPSSLSYCKDDDLHPKSTNIQGGIAQTIHGRHIGRIIKFHEDPIGRWS